MTLNRSAKTAMSASLVAIAAVAMYGWMVAPHVRYLYAVQDYEPVVQKAAKERSTLCQALGTKRRQLDSLRTELTALQAELFTPSQARDLFGDVETLCRAAGCSVVSVSFDSQSGGSRSPASSGPAVVMARRVHLAVSGRYDQIVTLLSQIQARPQRVCIDSCRVELFDLRSAGLKCDITMTLWVLCVGENPNGE
jgi:Tfp pilus assembly protein PilO